MFSGKKATINLSTSYICLKLLYDYEVTEMQKPFVLILLVFLLLSMLQFVRVVTPSSQTATLTQAVSDSVIQNGGFEQGVTGWANAGGGLLAVSTDNPHSGNYSLEISSPISQQAYFYQFVDMPNTSFVYSFWVFRVDEKSWTACYLGRDWDGNTLRPVSSLIIQDDTIQLNAWDNPYAPGRQVFNYDVTVGVWHNMTFLANATLGTQDFYIDGNLTEHLNSSSGNVFNPDVLIFGDVSTDSCNGTFYFDDLELNALGPANIGGSQTLLKVVNPVTGDDWLNFTADDKKVGDTFIVNVTIANVEEMVCWQFALQWNSSLLECVNATIPSDSVFAYWNVSGEPLIVGGPDLSHNGLVFCGAEIAYPGNGGFNGSGVLAQVELKILKEGGQSDFTFEGIKGDTFLLSNNLGDISFVPMNAHYSHSGVDPLGDVNNDGTVDMRDIVAAVLAFNASPGTLRWNGSADLDGNGLINMRDVVMIVLNFKHG
jgi:hypothetical protein